MKILYCLDGTYNSGGKERIVIAKANYLAAAGHEVFIVTSEQKGREDFFPLQGVKRIDTDIDFRSIASQDPIRKAINYSSKHRNYRNQLEKIIRETTPDIIISTFGYEVDTVADIKFGGKKILESHFTKNFRIYRGRKGIWKLIDRYKTRQDKKNLKKFHRFVCLTREDKNNWGDAGIEVINNFISKKTEKAASLDEKRVLSVGRLTHQKGYDRLIKAWEEVHNTFPDWQLDIYGDGPLRDKLQKQIEESGLGECVRLNGAVKDIHNKYMESSAFVMTSHYEGMPMVMLEAMEAGLPIISFDFECGPKDLIEEGVNGLLVKNGDIDGLAQAIIKIISDKELRKKMGQASFRMAGQYMQESIMAKWQELFNHLALCE